MHEGFWIVALVSVLLPRVSECKWLTVCFGETETLSCEEVDNGIIVISEAWLGEVPYAIEVDSSSQLSSTNICPNTILSDPCSHDVSLLMSYKCSGNGTCRVDHIAASFLHANPLSQCLKDPQKPPLHIRYICASDEHFKRICDRTKSTLPHPGGYFITQDYHIGGNMAEDQMQFNCTSVYNAFESSGKQIYHLQLRLLDMNYPHNPSAITGNICGRSCGLSPVLMDSITFTLPNHSKTIVCSDCAWDPTDLVGGIPRTSDRLHPLFSRIILPLVSSYKPEFKGIRELSPSKIRQESGKKGFLVEYIVLYCNPIPLNDTNSSQRMLLRYSFDPSTGRVLAEFNCLSSDTYLFHSSSHLTYAFTVSYLQTECSSDYANWTHSDLPTTCLNKNEITAALLSATTTTRQTSTTAEITTNHFIESTSSSVSFNGSIHDNGTVVSSDAILLGITTPIMGENRSSRFTQDPRQDLTWLGATLFGLIAASLLVVCIVLIRRRKSRKSIDSYHTQETVSNLLYTSATRPFLQTQGRHSRVKDGFILGSWWKFWRRGANYSPLGFNSKPFAHNMTYSQRSRITTPQSRRPSDTRFHDPNTRNILIRNNQLSNVESESMLISMNSTSGTLLSVVPPSNMWDSSAPTSPYMESSNDHILSHLAHDKMFPSEDSSRRDAFLQDSNSPSTVTSNDDSSGHTPQTLSQHVLQSHNPGCSSHVQMHGGASKTLQSPSINTNSVFDDDDNDCVLPVRRQKSGHLKFSQIVSRFSNSWRISNALSSPSQKASGSPSVSQQYMQTRPEIHSGVSLSRSQKGKKQSSTLPVGNNWPESQEHHLDSHKSVARNTIGKTKFPRHRRDSSIGSMVISPSVETYLEPNNQMRPSETGSSHDFDSLDASKKDSSTQRKARKHGNELTKEDKEYWEYDQKKRKQRDLRNNSTNNRVTSPAIRDSFIGMQSNNYYGDSTETYEIDSNGDRTQNKNGRRSDSVYEVVDEDPYEDTTSSIGEECKNAKSPLSGLLDENSSQPSTLLTPLSPMSDGPCSSNVAESLLHLTPTTTRRNMALPPRPQPETDDDLLNVLT